MSATAAQLAPRRERAPRTFVSPWWIGAAALITLAAFALHAAATGLGEAGRSWALGGYGAAFVVYGAVVAAAWRGHLRVPLWATLLVGVVGRALVLAGEPLLSDDLWRYLWDGHLQTQGINPYLHAPSSEALAPWRTPFWPQINHPDVPTIYPPVAQMVFALGALFGGDRALRALIVVAELVGVLAIGRLVKSGWRGWGRARLEGAPGRELALGLYLWNPLVIIEFAGSGHLDALALAPLLWALALLAPRRAAEGAAPHAPLGSRAWWWAGACLGLSVGAKLLGVIALPFLLVWAWWPTGRTAAEPTAPRLRRAAALLGGLAVVTALTFTPYFTGLVFGEGASFARGFSEYARKWRWNDGAYALVVETNEAALEAFAPRPGGPDVPPTWRADRLQSPLEWLGVTHVHEGRRVVSTTFTLEEVAASVTKGALALLLALLALTLLHQRADATEGVMALIGAALLVAPVVHPWYVAWLVPLAAARRFAPFLLWSGTVVLSYGIGADGGPWLRALEYAPVIAWAVIAGLRRASAPGALDFDARPRAS